MKGDKIMKNFMRKAADLYVEYFKGGLIGAAIGLAVGVPISLILAAMTPDE